MDDFSPEGPRQDHLRPWATRHQFGWLIGLAFLVGSTAFGLAGGAAVALWRSGDVAAADQGPRIGQWTFPRQAGSLGASPLERARMARTGTLALAASEAVYFVSDRDLDGARLDPACVYTVTIDQPPDARWWSLTVYNEHNRYILGDVPRASLNSAQLSHQDRGASRLTIGPDETGPSGIPTRGADAINLLLRVYNPSQAWRARLPDVRLPIVEKSRC